MMQTQRPNSETMQSLMQSGQISGSLSFNGSLSKEDEEMSNSALSTFRAKEEEIEKKKLEVQEKVQAQLGRIEEESKRLATIREELEALADPMRKEVASVRKKIDAVNKELKPLGYTCQKKEREYKEALDTFNEKNKEKSQLITRLMELVGESEKMRLKKLEELSKSIETIRGDEAELCGNHSRGRNSHSVKCKRLVQLGRGLLQCGEFKKENCF